VKLESLLIEETFLHIPDQRVFRLKYLERNATGFGSGKPDMLSKMCLHKLNVARSSANKATRQAHMPCIVNHSVSH